MRILLLCLMAICCSAVGWAQCTSDFEVSINGLEVTFTNNSTAADGETVDFDGWDFGNGETNQGASQETFVYTYPEAGDYEVCLAILTSAFCEDQSCQSITVEDIGGGTCLAPFILNTASNAGDEISLEWTNATGAVEFQVTVFDSASGDEILVEQTTDLAITITSELLEACTEYVVGIVSICANGELSDSSTPSFITTNCGTGGEYCEIENNSQDEYIESFSFGQIDNFSGNDDGYADYTFLDTDAGLGQTLQATITPGYEGGSFNEIFNIYIDFNQNFNFEEDELVFQSDPTDSAIEADITIDSGAELGETRMRIVMLWENNIDQLDPCGEYGFGETEDYTINITADPVDECDADFNFFLTPNGIQFNSTSSSFSGVITDYEWRQDGALVGDEETLLIDFEPGAAPLICLEITTSTGCENQYCDVIELSPPGCEPPTDLAGSSDATNQVSVSCAPVDGAEAYTFILLNADGAEIASAEADDPDTVIESPNIEDCLSYQLIVIAECDDNSESFPSDPISVNSYCVGCNANFTFDNIGGTIYEFNSTSTSAADITLFQWTVNGEDESIQDNLTIDLPNQSTVCLSIETADGCEDEYCQVVGGNPSSCQTPTGLTVTSDNFFEISASANPSSGDAFGYIFIVLDQDGNEILNEFSPEPEVNFINDLLEPCELFSVSVSAICGFGDQSLPSPPVEIEVFCEGCNVEFTYTQINETEFVLFPDVIASGDVTSYEWTIDGEFASDEEGPILEVADGQEVCLTIMTDDDCMETFCDIVFVDVSGCPTPESLVVEVNTDGTIEVISEPIDGGFGYVFIVSTNGQEIANEFSPDPNYTFDNLELLTCFEYDVSIQGICGFGDFSFPLTETILANCDEGCGASFSFEDQGGGEYDFESNSGAVGEIISYEWTVDGELVSDEENPTLDIDDSEPVEVCLTIATDDDCTADYCALVFDGCIPPSNVEVESVGNTVTVNFDGPNDVQGFRIRILDASGDILEQQFTNSAGASIEFELDLPACSEYIAQVETVCQGGGPGGGEFSDPVQTTFLFNCEEGCGASFVFTGLGPGNFEFTSTAGAVGEIISYEWTIDGEVASDEENPTLEIDEINGQEVCLTITTDDDCTNEFCQEIQSDCPATEILNFEVTGPNSFELEVFEAQNNYQFRVTVFDINGDEVFQDLFQDPDIEVVDDDLIECSEYTVVVEVRCQGGPGGGVFSFPSAPESFTTECIPGYCESAANNSNDEHIDQVTIGTINNLSGNNGGYADFTDLSTVMSIGEDMSITLTPGYGGGEFPEQFFVFIDWDINEAFSPNELVAQSDIVQEEVTLNFTVPNDATAGPTRMRIVMSYNGDQDQPCGDYTWGETEDYTVVVVEEGEEYCFAQFSVEYYLDGVILMATPTSSGVIDSYEWTLDGELMTTDEIFDGQVEDGQEICLSILSDSGCIDTICQTFEFSCEAGFDSFNGGGGGTTFFSDSESSTDILGYEWTLDGDIVSEEEFYFPIDGIDNGAEICLTIYAGGGCSNTYCETFDLDCTAFFTYTIDGQTVTFNSGSEAPSANDNFQIQWDFGDGGGAPPFGTVQHDYSVAGTYTACITINANDGCSDSYCEEITIEEVGGECEEPVVTIVETTQSSISLSWSVPNGAESYNYVVFQGFDIITEGVTNDTEITIVDGLEPCQEYGIVIESVCDPGTAATDINASTECPDAIEDLGSHYLGNNYPNPANQSTTILLNDISQPMELVITNVLGQNIAQYSIAANSSQIDIDTEHLDAGAYIFQLIADGQILGTNKMMIVH